MEIEFPFPHFSRVLNPLERRDIESRNLSKFRFRGWHWYCETAQTGFIAIHPTKDFFVDVIITRLIKSGGTTDFPRKNRCIIETRPVEMQFLSTIQLQAPPLPIHLHDSIIDNGLRFKEID